MAGTNVFPLAAGIRGAESGYVEFYPRGETSGSVAAYSDPECTIPLSTPIRLDANGGLEAYVKLPCWAVVRNASQVPVRRFTVVVGENHVDITNASFDGTLSNGGQGAGGLTSLVTALAGVYSSFKARGFKVRRTGATADETIVQALDAVKSTNQTEFNIKTYGAVGDGATDDTAAWVKAHAAAVAAGGGTIYVPASANPYFFASAISVSAQNIKVRGDGPTVSRLRFGIAALGTCLTVNPGASSFSGNALEGFGIDCASAQNVCGLTVAAAPGTLVERIKISNCGLPIEFQAAGIVIGCDFTGANTAGSAYVVKVSNGAAEPVLMLANHIVLASTNTGGTYFTTRPLIAVGNTIEMQAAVGTARGFHTDSIVSEGSVIIGNRFLHPNGAVVCYGISRGVDVAMHMLGNTSLTAAGSALTVGALYVQGGANYIAQAARGERDGININWATGAAITPNINVRSENFTPSAGPVTVNAPTGSASAGQRYTMGIRNTTGAGLVINAFGGGAANFHGTVGAALANNTIRFWVFEYQIVSGVGAWYQISASVDVT